MCADSPTQIALWAPPVVWMPARAGVDPAALHKWSCFYGSFWLPLDATHLYPSTAQSTGCKRQPIDPLRSHEQEATACARLQASLASCNLTCITTAGLESPHFQKAHFSCVHVQGERLSSLLNHQCLLPRSPAPCSPDAPLPLGSVLHSKKAQGPITFCIQTVTQIEVEAGRPAPSTKPPHPAIPLRFVLRLAPPM